VPAHILAAAVEAGDAPPEDVVPEVWPACAEYWAGFWVLHRARGYHVGMSGMAPQPLAYGDMVTWARVQAEDVDTAVTLLQQMDGEWLAHYWKTHASRR